jgi:exodeoxyribonuclease VII large subunit
MGRRISHDGRGRLQVRFPYDPDLVNLVKAVPNRRWVPERRVWTVPDTEVVRLVELLQPLGFRLDSATRELYTALGGTLEVDGTPDDRMPGPSNAVGDAAADDFRVSRLNREVHAAIEAIFPSSVWLVGEISGFNKSSHRRHVGFQLVERDDGGREVAQVNAILFEGARRLVEDRLAAAGQPFVLEDEIEVRLQVRVEVYEAWGQYRVRVEDLDVSYTLGEAARRREEIVRRLTADGLVGVNSALPFPDVPLRIGLITSLQSDAFNDVVRTLQESGFAFHVTAHGARVQGRATEPSILNALDLFRRRTRDLDVLMICRGGGSRTDLAWLDSEALGRAVATFPIPVVVGIGHEQDLSVLDAVARRAKTPTAAAAMLVDRVREFLGRTETVALGILAAASRLAREERAALVERTDRLVRAARHRVERESVESMHRRLRVARGVRALLEAAGLALSQRTRGIPRAAAALLARRAAELDRAARQTAQGARRDLAAARRRIAESVAALPARSHRMLDLEAERAAVRRRRLRLVDPRRVVERGYAIVRDDGGRVVTGTDMAPAGVRLRAELRHGRLRLRSEGPEGEPGPSGAEDT